MMILEDALTRKELPPTAAVTETYMLSFTEQEESSSSGELGLWHGKILGKSCAHGRFLVKREK